MFRGSSVRPGNKPAGDFLMKMLNSGDATNVYARDRNGEVVVVKKLTQAELQKQEKQLAPPRPTRPVRSPSVQTWNGDGASALQASKMLPPRLPKLKLKLITDMSPRDKKRKLPSESIASSWSEGDDADFDAMWEGFDRDDKGAIIMSRSSDSLTASSNNRDRGASSSTVAANAIRAIDPERAEYNDNHFFTHKAEEEKKRAAAYQKEYQKKYREDQDNKERVAAYKKAYREDQDNKERAAAYQKAYQKDPDNKERKRVYDKKRNEDKKRNKK